MNKNMLINLKKVTHGTLALLIVVSSFGFVPAVKAVGESTVTIGSQSASNGATINVPINASNFTDVGSIDFGVQYDASLLTYTGHATTTLSGTFDNDSINLVGNTITVSWPPQSVSLGNGEILTLNFTVISAAATNANLTVVGAREMANVAGDFIASSFVSGVITLNPSATLSSIAITTPATKLSYTVGDALDLTGLVVTGTYSDASIQVETVTASNVSGFDSSAQAVGQVLTITVGGQTATYTINVVGEALPSIGGGEIGLVTPHSVDFAWNWPGDSAVHFSLKQSTDGEQFNEVAQISAVADQAGYQYTFDQLMPNTSYWFSVETIDNIGFQSRISNVNPTVTLSSAPSNTQAIADSPTQITVSWTANSATSYKVTNVNDNIFQITNLTSQQFGDLVCGTQYSFSIAALNSIGVSSTQIALASATTQACPSGGGGSGGGGGGDTTVPEQSDLTALGVALNAAQSKHDAAVEGNLPGQYPAPLKANLLSAITTAATVTSVSAQSVVDAAVATLNAAVVTFEAGVVLPDTTVPVITLIGNATINLTVGDAYLDAGADATDNLDGNIADNIATVNPVNTAIAGTYTVTYNVSDAAGNAAVAVTRTVIVSEAVVVPPVAPQIGGGGGSAIVVLSSGGSGGGTTSQQTFPVAATAPVALIETVRTPAQQVLGVRVFAEGAILRVDGRSMYIAQGNTLHIIPNANVLSRFASRTRIDVTAEDISGYTMGSSIPNAQPTYVPRTLLRVDSRDIYVVNGRTLNRVPNPHTLWPYRDYARMEVAGDALIEFAVGDSVPTL